jgi:hypothetical protein
MIKKIEKLTPEQEAYLPVFRDEWIKIGLSTERVDKDRATAAIKALYAAAGEAEPVVMHFDSPMQCIMAINFFRHFKAGAEERANLGDNLRDNLGANLWDNLRDNLGANLWANLGDNLRDNLGANLWDNLRDNLGANLWANLGDNLRDNLGANLRANLWANLGANLWANLGDNLWANLGANLRANLRANLGANLRANLGDNLWANLGANLWANLGAKKIDFVDTYFWAGQDAPWIAFYQFGQKIGVPYGKQAHLDAYVEFSKSCGWMYAYKGVAFVSDRPTIIAKDDETRLHSETGPSIAFADGYEMYSWHGTNIPGEWIKDKSSITAKIALTWENIEQRRVACEIVGWAKILRELDAKVIDADGDPLIGTLVEVRLPDLDVPARFCRVQCGTGREFAIGVPPEIETAMAAQAWMVGLQPHEFTRPEIRT